MAYGKLMACCGANDLTRAEAGERGEVQNLGGEWLAKERRLTAFAHSDDTSSKPKRLLLVRRRESQGRNQAGRQAGRQTDLIASAKV
jgi:hypothetical protein